jgi:hypothetical protein
MLYHESFTDEMIGAKNLRCAMINGPLPAVARERRGRRVKMISPGDRLISLSASSANSAVKLHLQSSRSL